MLKLKHVYIGVHEGEELDSIKCEAKVLCHTQTAFEWQIRPEKLPHPGKEKSQPEKELEMKTES